MAHATSLSREQLREPFLKHTHKTPQKLIGLEVEMAAVDPKTGISKSYTDKGGIRDLLTAFNNELKGQAIMEGPNIIGSVLPDRSTITIEPGGAIEYSSQPGHSLAELLGGLNSTLAVMRTEARAQGSAMLSGGMMPFNELSKANWMPKSRYDIMRAHFQSLGEAGSLAWRMMTQTLSVQVSYDFDDEDDLSRKMTALVLAAPLGTALFANSPIEESKVLGCQSRRAQIWLKTDPARCGFVPPAMKRGMKLNDFIDWALEVPMMFRVEGKSHTAMKGRLFSDIRQSGFVDGQSATLEDWNHHLSGIFTDVRLKSVLELRSLDGQAQAHIPCVPVFWTGLVYDSDAITGLLDLLTDRPAEQYFKALPDIAKHGIEARLGDDPVRELLKEMLSLSRRGLEKWVADGRDEASVLDFLKPLEEIVAGGPSFSDQVIERWQGEFQRDPAAYVAAYEVQDPRS